MRIETGKFGIQDLIEDLEITINDLYEDIEPEMLCMAFDSLKEQFAKQSSIHLTREEVEGMVGEPLWVVPLEKDADWEPCWVICGDDYSMVKSKSSESRVWLLRANEYYGKTWIAYRNKP